MRSLEILYTILLAGLCLPVVVIGCLAVVWAMEDRPPRPRHAVRAPRRPVRGPGMPIPYWTREERPAPFLIDLRDGPATDWIDPVDAEIATWRPWELETGEFPAIIDAMGARLWRRWRA